MIFKSYYNKKKKNNKNKKARVKSNLVKYRIITNNDKNNNENIIIPPSTQEYVEEHQEEIIEENFLTKMGNKSVSLIKWGNYFKKVGLASSFFYLGLIFGALLVFAILCSSLFRHAMTKMNTRIWWHDDWVQRANETNYEIGQINNSIFSNSERVFKLLNNRINTKFYNVYPDYDQTMTLMSQNSKQKLKFNHTTNALYDGLYNFNQNKQKILNDHKKTLRSIWSEIKILNEHQNKPEIKNIIAKINKHYDNWINRKEGKPQFSIFYFNQFPMLDKNDWNIILKELDKELNILGIDKQTKIKENIPTEETVKELPTSTEMVPAQPQTLTTSEDSTTESKEVDHVVEKQADELTQEHALEKLVGEEEKWKNELLAEFGEKFKLKYTFEFKTITEKLYTAQKIDHKSLIYLLFHYIYKLYVVSNMTVKYESIFDYLSVYIKNKDITIWKKKQNLKGLLDINEIKINKIFQQILDQQNIPLMNLEEWKENYIKESNIISDLNKDFKTNIPELFEINHYLIDKEWWKLNFQFYNAKNLSYWFHENTNVDESTKKKQHKKLEKEFESKFLSGKLNEIFIPTNTTNIFFAERGKLKPEDGKTRFRHWKIFSNNLINIIAQNSSDKKCIDNLKTMINIFSDSVNNWMLQQYTENELQNNKDENIFLIISLLLSFFTDSRFIDEIIFLTNKEKKEKIYRSLEYKNIRSIWLEIIHILSFWIKKNKKIKEIEEVTIYNDTNRLKHNLTLLNSLYLSWLLEKNKTFCQNSKISEYDNNIIKLLQQSQISYTQHFMFIPILRHSLETKKILSKNKLFYKNFLNFNIALYCGTKKEKIQKFIDKLNEFSKYTNFLLKKNLNNEFELVYFDRKILDSKDLCYLIPENNSKEKYCLSKQEYNYNEQFLNNLVAKSRNKIARMDRNIKDIVHQLSLIRKNDKIYLKMESGTMLDRINITGLNNNCFLSKFNVECSHIIFSSLQSENNKKWTDLEREKKIEFKEKVIDNLFCLIIRNNDLFKNSMFYSILLKNKSGNTIGFENNNIIELKDDKNNEYFIVWLCNK